MMMTLLCYDCGNEWEEPVIAENSIGLPSDCPDCGSFATEVFGTIDDEESAETIALKPFREDSDATTTT